MKTISKNVTCTVLGFLTMLFLAPSFVTAEGNGSHLPLQIEVNLLDNNPDKADIVDVEVNNLLGIESINIKIPNEGEKKEALVTASVIDEEIGDTEVSVLSQSETKTASEKALVDMVTEDSLIVDEVNVDMMNQQETLTDTEKISKEAVVEIELENLAIVKDVEIGVLKQEQVQEGTTSSHEDQGVHAKITDLPVLGTLHVGILESEKKEANEEYVDNSKLLTIGLENAFSTKNAILDGLELNVLENNNMKNDAFEKHKSSVVGAELADQVLGNTAINVLLSESIKEGYFTKYDSGVIELVSNELPVLNEVHLGILDRHSQSSEKAKSFSKGVLQLDVISDVIGRLDADVLTNKGYTDSGGTTEKDKTISLGLDNVLGSVGINILPRESYLTAPPIINPSTPNNDPDESTDETSEGNNNEGPVAVDDNKEGSTEGNQGTDDMNDSTNDGKTGTFDETTNEVGATEEENSLVGFSANSNGLSGNNSLSNTGIFTGSSLPKTGGFLNSIMLLLLAVCLLVGGVTIRKFA